MCLCVCVHACMCVCLRACVCVCVCVRACVLDVEGNRVFASRALVVLVAVHLTVNYISDRFS